MKELVCPNCDTGRGNVASGGKMIAVHCAKCNFSWDVPFHEVLRAVRSDHTAALAEKDAIINGLLTGLSNLQAECEAKDRRIAELEKENA